MNQNPETQKTSGADGTPVTAAHGVVRARPAGSAPVRAQRRAPTPKPGNASVSQPEPAPAPKPVPSPAPAVPQAQTVKPAQTVQPKVNTDASPNGVPTAGTPTPQTSAVPAKQIPAVQASVSRASEAKLSSSQPYNAAARRAAAAKSASKGTSEAPSVLRRRRSDVTAQTKVVGTAEKKDTGRASAASGLLRVLVYIVAVLIVATVLGYFGIQISNDVFALMKADESVSVDIPEYTTLGELSQILYDNGLIKYPWIFRIYCSRGKAVHPDFVPGTYSVSAKLSYDELYKYFQRSTRRETVRIAFPEGYTVDEIIGLLVENGVGSREGFIEVINHYDFAEYGFRCLENLEVTDDRSYRLEGYLYPDTYDFYKARGITEDDDLYIYQDEAIAIARFLERLDSLFTDAFYDRLEELNMSLDEALTLASIIEKEGRYVSEFEDISSVFHNRLNHSANFPHLESDATIVYAIQCKTGIRPDTVLPEDKYLEHPYNTYYCNGLPPGPIASPGFNAITCALYPSSTNYYYFVSRKDGTTLFASTYAQHEANIIAARSEGE